jgi:hypothetical protein
MTYSRRGEDMTFSRFDLNGFFDLNYREQMRRRAIAVDLGICFASPADGYAARVDENGVIHSESGLGFHVGPMAARKSFFREIMGKVVGATCCA